MSERLQKIISASGLMSRRAAEEAISQGRVSLNGVKAALGDKAELPGDSVLVDGKPLPSVGEKLYIMVNKPKGYVTTMDDEKGRKNVTELTAQLGARLYPVGRLDINSEGLLVMTNDGDFANRLMHPSHNFMKTYYTWVEGDDIGEAAKAMGRPLDIDGYTIRPAQVEILEHKGRSAKLSVAIAEGRNRQVRKMCAQCGLYVKRLCRVAEGPLKLGGLQSGQWRRLTAEEIAAISD